MRTSKLRETPELKMGNPEPNPVFRKQGSESENQKKDRCRDSMEAVLTNRVDCIGKGILSFYPNDRKDDLVYVRIHTETSND